MVAQAGLQAAPIPLGYIKVYHPVGRHKDPNSIPTRVAVSLESDVRWSRRLTQRLVAVPVVTATYSGPI